MNEWVGEWMDKWTNMSHACICMYMIVYVHTNVNVFVHMSNENDVKRGGWCPMGMSIKIDDLYQTPFGDVSHLMFRASYFYTTWDGLGGLTLKKTVSVSDGLPPKWFGFTCWRVSSVGDRPIKIIPCNPLVTPWSAGIVITTLRSEPWNLFGHPIWQLVRNLPPIFNDSMLSYRHPGLVSDLFFFGSHTRGIWY